LERELGAEANIDRQPLQPGDVPQTFADITKARRLLGYDPQTQIRTRVLRSLSNGFEERAGTSPLPNPEFPAEVFYNANRRLEVAAN